MSAPAGQPTIRLRLALRGAVQGVGFRPFVFRLASELGLVGFARNSPQGLLVEAEGRAPVIDEFRQRILQEKPPRAYVQGMETWQLEPLGREAFEILESEGAGERGAFVLPDIAPCPDCLREILDPADCRHRYPFTNCTNCGPRFTILEALPYDRANTTMRAFAMCPACRSEYEDPADRRFHAQPNACPACGPQLALWDREGKALAERDAALRGVARAIREGKIVALKGVGGFHLVCDARDDAAVARLRARKRREEKPLAVMVADLRAAETLCDVSEDEARLLSSPEAPIVLLRKSKIGNQESEISSGIAPANPRLGLLLPSSPLHHLLCRDLGFPIVATSGNLSDEPICTDERDALERLRGIADLFLVHDRPVARHADDSILRVVDGKEVMLRRARGYAPMPLPIPVSGRAILGVGAHLKNAIALARGGEVIVSQHLGDMDTPESRAAFERAVADVQRLHAAPAVEVACDHHPDYATTAFARGLGLPVKEIQHHLAHAVACLAENEVEGPALAVVWDGTGHGPDGSVWGGEFLRVDGASWERVGHLRRFRLPGGEAAVREPRRSALGLLAEIGARSATVEKAFTDEERRVIASMRERGVNAPWTTSAGRLFDAVAAIVGLRPRHAFEAQAAMELEWAAEAAGEVKPYPIRIAPVGQAPRLPTSADGSGPALRSLGEGGSGFPTTPEIPRRAWNDQSCHPDPAAAGEGPLVLDWQPMVEAILADAGRGRPVAEIAAAFHAALAQGIVEVAQAVGEKRVALTGGCFQNGVLLSRASCALRVMGFQVLLHQRLPPNDGSIAFGQVVAAAKRMGEKSEENVKLRVRKDDGRSL